MTWRNVWTATTRYKKGDVVRYGGQVYICNTGPTAAATDALGLEANPRHGITYTKVLNT